MNDHEDPAAEGHECATWSELVQHLEQFPPPTISFDESVGDVESRGWVFRGLADASYRLQPAIERDAATRAAGWAALELLVSAEFRSRAHMHIGAASMPKDELTWLALMQHYAIPTRLLDFSYSPFVALYFAIRNRGSENRSGGSESRTIRLWAIDAHAVNNRFRRVAWQVEEQEDKERRKAKLPQKSRAVSFDPDSAYTSRDSVAHEMQGLEATIAAALAATGARRRVQAEKGCVCVAAPPAFNPRLASQQDVFLLNCAEELTFCQSLMRMMKPEQDWCQTFDIPPASSP